jgi:glycosyltransferase involved in cell wall biosynthesis
VRVLVLTSAPYDTSGPRYRIEQWARHLGSDGFQFTFAPFESEALHNVIYQPGRYTRKAMLTLEACVRRFQTIAMARDFDVVLIFREAMLVGPAVIEHFLAREGLPIVFDFDDAIWVPYRSPSNTRWSYLKCFGKAATICRLSARVIVGNRHLADYARRFNTNVVVVPSTIDTDVYSARRPSADEDDHLVTIGWTGSHSTVQHLDTLRPALARLRQRCAFRLHVIGATSYTVDGVETVVQPWRAESEARDLHSFDIGIMPLPDGDWNRGKCGMKLLQYMGAGVPAVGSPVGMNAEIIRDGVDGFLASTEEEWVEKLCALIRDRRLRHDIGGAGRRTVEERYSARVWAPKVGEILESAAAASSPRRRAAFAESWTSTIK